MDKPLVKRSYGFKVLAPLPRLIPWTDRVGQLGLSAKVRNSKVGCGSFLEVLKMYAGVGFQSFELWGIQRLVGGIPKFILRVGIKF